LAQSGPSQVSQLGSSGPTPEQVQAARSSWRNPAAYVKHCLAVAPLPGPADQAPSDAPPIPATPAHRAGKDRRKVSQPSASGPSINRDGASATPVPQEGDFLCRTLPPVRHGRATPRSGDRRHLYALPPLCPEKARNPDPRPPSIALRPRRRKTASIPRQPPCPAPVWCR